MKRSHQNVLAVFIAVSSVAFCATPLWTHAAGPVVRSGEEVSVEAQKVLEGDFYGFGGTVNISAESKEDVYVAGGTVTTNGVVAHDLTVVGGVVQVHGAIGDDVRIIAGDVTIAEPVEGDVVVLAGKVDILSTATVKGDVLILTGDAQIDGPVEGSVYGTAGSLRINTHIAGDVSVRATDSFVLGDMANIDGNVTYKSSVDIVRAQGAVIAGDVHKETFITETDTDVMKALMLELVVFLFAALSLFLVFRTPLTKLTTLTQYEYGKMGLIGFGVFFGMPFVGLVFVASVLGLFVGLPLLLTYFMLLAVSIIGTCVVTGAFITRMVMKHTEVSTLSVILGTVAMSVLSLIPVVGALVILFTFFVTLGGISTLFYKALK